MIARHRPRTGGRERKRQPRLRRAAAAAEDRGEDGGQKEEVHLSRRQIAPSCMRLVAPRLWGAAPLCTASDLAAAAVPEGMVGWSAACHTAAPLRVPAATAQASRFPGAVHVAAARRRCCSAHVPWMDMLVLPPRSPCTQAQWEGVPPRATAEGGVRSEAPPRERRVDSRPGDPRVATAASCCLVAN